ncbi:MAG TPA: hypothetical protein VN677_14775 [Gemmatimonadaceae bacterium]|jgi:hypothetical protein|nr:hypothetical protein [Gemmatimonadaceae bacterium]
MKTFVAIALMVVVAGCSRKVKVNTAPTPTPAAAADVSFEVSNNLTQPVNVYVTSAGADILAGQVGPNSTQALTARGVPSGSMVTLKARTVDGTRTYTKDDVAFTSGLRWAVP